MPQLGRRGSVTITLPIGQSVVVGSFGTGSAKISLYAASVSLSGTGAAMQLAMLQGGTYYYTNAAAIPQNILIEASNGCELEYAFGTAPSLTFNPFSVVVGLVAKAGGGQALATPLTGSINRISTAATAGDSVLLPVADVLGKPVTVFNAGAASMNVFGQSGDAIGTGAANAAFAVGAGKGARFEVVVTNNAGAAVWTANLSA